jgi:TrmH family RNA methyltransferase
MLHPIGVSEPAGRRHPLARKIRALRADPRRREAEDVFLAEGIHLAQAALAARAPIVTAAWSTRLLATEEGRELHAALEGAGTAAVEVDPAVLSSIQDARSPQPITLVVRRPRWPPDAGLDAEAPGPLVVAACGVQDPGNLGTIVRTADAAGATACFACEGCADPFHPRAVRASMGSIFRLPVPRRAAADLAREGRARGLNLVATDPRGTTPLFACDLRGPLAVFLGSEGTGLPQDLLDASDWRVRIPLRRGVESLSVGAAAAVLLFEAVRQRGGFGDPLAV